MQRRSIGGGQMLRVHCILFIRLLSVCKFCFLTNLMQICDPTSCSRLPHTLLMFAFHDINCVTEKLYPNALTMS